MSFSFSKMSPNYGLAISMGMTTAASALCCGGLHGYYQVSEHLALQNITDYEDVYIDNEFVKYDVTKGGAAYEHYEVFGKTPDGMPHVFKNYDSWISKKNNAQRIKKEIEEGATCDFTVYGWPKWQYENILKVKCSR